MWVGAQGWAGDVVFASGVCTKRQKCKFLTKLLFVIVGYYFILPTPVSWLVTGLMVCGVNIVCCQNFYDHYITF